jgi:hypothetical protein
MKGADKQMSSGRKSRTGQMPIKGQEKRTPEIKKKQFVKRTWRGAGLGLGQGTEWNRDNSELS